MKKPNNEKKLEKSSFFRGNKKSATEKPSAAAEIDGNVCRATANTGGGVDVHIAPVGFAACCIVAIKAAFAVKRGIKAAILEIVGLHGYGCTRVLPRDDGV